MPFKNQMQAAACFAKHDPNWDCSAWAHETPGGIKDLPKRSDKSAKNHHMLREMHRSMTSKEG